MPSLNTSNNTCCLNNHSLHLLPIKIRARKHREDREEEGVEGADAVGRRGVREEQEGGGSRGRGGGAREERKQRHMVCGLRERGRERKTRKRKRERESHLHMHLPQLKKPLRSTPVFSPHSSGRPPQPPRLLSLFCDRIDDDVIYFNARCCCNTGSKFLAHSGDSDGVC